MPVIIMLAPHRKEMTTIVELQPGTSSGTGPRQHDHVEPYSMARADTRDPGPQREPQRRIREADDAVDAQARASSATDIWSARGARRPLEGHDGLPEPDPGEQAANEAVALRAWRRKHPRTLRSISAEVTDVCRDLDSGDAADQPVEQLGRGALEAALAGARRSRWARDDLEPLPPFGRELQDQLGRVLQVGVHDDHGIAACEVEPGRDGDLMAEIARQAHVFDSARPFAPVASRTIGGQIATAVVDEDHLCGPVEPRQQRLEPRAAARAAPPLR